MKKSLGVPAFNNMMCEMFQAIRELGGSGTIGEIDARTMEILRLTPQVQGVMGVAAKRKLSTGWHGRAHI